MEDDSYSIGEVTKNGNWIFQACTGIAPVSWTELPVRKDHELVTKEPALNTVIAIGYTGGNDCYLNISIEEAFEYHKAKGDDRNTPCSDFEEFKQIADIFTFDKCFYAYEIGTETTTEEY
jgi:hypothetical protein